MTTRPADLRDRIASDGYLFLRGILPKHEVESLRRAVLAALHRHHWLAEGTDPAEARPGPTPRTFGDEQWYDAYSDIVGLEAFNRLAHHPNITNVLERALGGVLLVHPRKIGRVKFPGVDHPTPPHQDYFFIRGATDALTVWIPLGDAPPVVGGLAVLRGSHRNGLLDAVQMDGEGGWGVEADPNDPDWVTADYRAGDAVVFHSLLVHRGSNNSSDRLRLSVDYRYQRADEPITADSLLPHMFSTGQVAGWGHLARDWESRQWASVPDGLTISIADISSKTPLPSRLLES